MDREAIERAIRDFPGFSGWGNETYGLDDLDFDYFVSDLAEFIKVRLEIGDLNGSVLWWN